MQAQRLCSTVVWVGPSVTACVWCWWSLAKAAPHGFYTFGRVKLPSALVFCLCVQVATLAVMLTYWVAAAHTRAGRSGGAPCQKHDGPRQVAERCPPPPPPQLQYWHASVGKSTSHEAGKWIASQFLWWQAHNLIWCDADNDNMTTQICSHLRNAPFIWAKCPWRICARKAQTYAGCVGRTLYPHVDFGELGCYDTDGVWGRGYDDMVLRDSLRALHYMSNSEGFPVIVTKGKRQVFLGTAVLLSPWAKHGGALPHDSNMFKYDRSECNIAHNSATRLPEHEPHMGDNEQPQHGVCANTACRTEHSEAMHTLPREWRGGSRLPDDPEAICDDWKIHLKCFVRGIGGARINATRRLPNTDYGAYFLIR